MCKETEDVVVNLSTETQMEASPDTEVGSRGRFDAELERINAALEAHLSSRVPLVEEIARYSVLGEGKRLRPLLFVLSARACGLEGEDLYRSSVIFEMVHAASLLHDDVLDNAEFRRKKLSSSKVWGNQAAVLGGDFLYSSALALALERENRPVLDRLSATTIRMAEGQMLELAHTNDWDLTCETYMEIITAKTAVLMSAACACGALKAGANDRETESLSRFGMNLGVAFQMIDDLLDYTVSEEVFGKPVGKDVREGKVTLPLIRTLAGLGPGAEEIKARFGSGKAPEEDYDRLILRVREAPCLEGIRVEARGYMERAAQALEALAGSSARDDLLALNRRLLNRTY